jgi:hypothetical protein
MNVLTMNLTWITIREYNHDNPDQLKGQSRDSDFQDWKSYNCKQPNTFIGTRKLKMLIIQWHQSGKIVFTDETTIKIFNVCTVFETVCVCVCACVGVCLN